MRTGYLLNLWATLHRTALTMLHQGAGEGTMLALEKSILALKILRKLLVHGLKRIHEHTEATLFVEQLFPEAKNLLQARKTVGPCFRDLLEKYVVLHQKVGTYKNIIGNGTNDSLN